MFGTDSSQPSKGGNLKHSPDVARSHAYCKEVVRRSGSNFSLAFLFLPWAQRQAMYALYAFAREVDDLADGAASVADRRASVEQFEQQFSDALAGRDAGPLMPAVVDTIERFNVPVQHFRDIIAGIRMDLDHAGFETFDELRTYCLHVASAVGLACLPIWGVSDERANQPAVDCGLAFQMTNILRDVHEDAQLGRLYLPREDLRRFGCDGEDLFDHAHTQRVAELLNFEAERATAYFRSAATLEHYLAGPPRRVYALMYGRYEALLRMIRSDVTIVLSRKLRLNLLQKSKVVLNAALGKPLN
jgi:15-cis-phytoene synthase